MPGAAGAGGGTGGRSAFGDVLLGVVMLLSDCSGGGITATTLKATELYP